MQKTIVFIILFLGYYSTISAQEEFHYFNKVYQSDTNLMLSVTAAPIDDDFIIGGFFNWVGGYSAFYLRKIDHLGNEVWNTIIDGDVNFRTVQLGTAMNKTLDGNIIFAGGIGTSNLEEDFILIKVDPTGEVLFKKRYETMTKEGGSQVIVCEEGGYLLVGFTQIVEPDIEAPQVYLVRTDAQGNILWAQKHSEDVIPLYAEQTSDGGFLISGYQLNSGSSYDMYVLKTNSHGMVEWERTYGTLDNDGGCYATEHTNGDIIVLGIIRDNIVVENKVYFARVNRENGDIIQEKTHVKYDYYNPDATPHVDKNGNIVVITDSFGPIPLWEVAFTVFDINGDILIDEPISSGLSGEDYIRDLEPTADGGYVLAGFNYTSPQKSWVIKVDSLGKSCGTAPCDSTVLLDTAIGDFNFGIEKENFYVSPNPAVQECVLHYKLPLENPHAVVEIYNQQGNRVKRQLLSSAFREQQLDISDFSSGIYVYQIVVPSRVLFSGKLVVQK